MLTARTGSVQLRAPRCSSYWRAVLAVNNSPDVAISTATAARSTWTRCKPRHEQSAHLASVTTARRPRALRDGSGRLVDGDARSGFAKRMESARAFWRLVVATVMSNLGVELPCVCAA